MEILEAVWIGIEISICGYFTVTAVFSHMYIVYYIDKSADIMLIHLQGGDSISPIKTPKYSFVRTNMQCGFIKVVRMKRGFSNYKMTVSS